MKALSTEPTEPKVEADSSTLPASTTADSSTPLPKGKPEAKAPSVAKAPPPGAEAEIQKLWPFLRFGADIDSDVAKTNLTSADLTALPESSLKP